MPRADQPRVFHRDYRLRGKIFEEPYLLVRERLGFPAIGGNDAK